jgi:Lrp/AsnC family leucine-responsive transcriptional regulator
VAETVLDQIDIAILRELQSNGRVSNIELADRVGLSESPCLRRVRRLEHEGLISGYHAHLDVSRLGRAFSVYVGVKMQCHSSEHVLPFEEWVRAHPEVATCDLISGDFDYLLHIAVADLNAYERFLTEHLLCNPAISDIRTMIALRSVKKPFGVEAHPTPLGRQSC